MDGKRAWGRPVIARFACCLLVCLSVAACGGLKTGKGKTVRRSHLTPGPGNVLAPSVRAVLTGE